VRRRHLQGVDEAEMIEDAGPLFARARASDPVTSVAAAACMTERQLNPLCGRIVAACARAGAQGRTTIELEGELSVQRVSISPRMRQLAELGRLVEGPTRKGKNGRHSIAWCVPGHVEGPDA
jgi:hypothetical protein